MLSTAIYSHQRTRGFTRCRRAGCSPPCGQPSSAASGTSWSSRRRSDSPRTSWASRGWRWCAADWNRSCSRSTPLYSTRNASRVLDVVNRRGRVGGSLHCYTCRRCIEDPAVLEVMGQFETVHGSPVPEAFSHTTPGLFAKIESCEIHNEGTLIWQRFSVVLK